VTCYLLAYVTPCVRLGASTATCSAGRCASSGIGTMGSRSESFPRSRDGSGLLAA
jgi:hypothetical protein